MPIRLTRFHTPEERSLIEKVTREIDIVKETGEVVYGAQSTIRELQQGNAEIVLIARFGKEELIERLKYLCKISNTPSFIFPGDVSELGEACGRPHVIAAATVLDPGSSGILKLGKGKV